MLWILLVAGIAYGQDCGAKPPQRPWAPAITNGRDSDPNAWPWQLSLRYNADGVEPFGHTCGASLLSPNLALTAAHCVDPEIGGPERDIPANFRLIAGAHAMELTGSEQVLSVSEIIRHSRYVADSTIGFPNDIALLRLAAPANLDDPNVAVVCIPENSTHLFDGRPNCWMTGWGLVDFWDGRLPTVLQEGEQELLTNEECQAEFPFPNLRETHQCVGRGADGTPGACQGDSGGPLTCLEDNGKWYQVGVTSFGILGCEGAPSMYTRVAAYREWIIDRINAP